jgi:hypothetical protein
MELRVSSLVLLSALVIVHPTLPAQSATAAPPVTVLEARAQAVLGQNSIRVELPLSAPSRGRERIVARILSPANTASGETAVSLNPGDRAASLTLPWPVDSRREPVDEIGWYRIDYRIETPGEPARHGILSIGAIAPNLLALRLARPSKAAVG